MARITNTQRIAQLDAHISDLSANMAQVLEALAQFEVRMTAATPPAPPAKPTRAKSKAKSTSRAKKPAQWNYFACGRENCRIMREALRERLDQPKGMTWKQLTALADAKKVSYADIIAPFGG